MIGSIDRNGHCKVEWDWQVERLYSPDGQKQLLPCERCGQPQWCSLPTCSVVCEPCAGIIENGEEDEQLPEKPCSDGSIAV